MENPHGSANVLPKTYIKCMSNVLAWNPPRKPCKNSISTLLPTSNSIQYPQFPGSQLGIFPPTLLHQPAPPSNNTPHQIPCWFEFKSHFFQFFSLFSWHICKYLLSLLSRQHGGCLIFRFDFICSLLHIIFPIFPPFLLRLLFCWAQIEFVTLALRIRLNCRRAKWPSCMGYAKYLCAHMQGANKNAEH